MGTRIQWAPRLSPQLLRRLYRLNASGINDDELIDNVGIRLYLRCESIVLIAQKAFFCPECGKKILFEEDESTICTYCDSKYTLVEFHESYRHRNLWQGNAAVHFKKYYSDYPQTKTFNEKLIAIDTLIHSFHTDIKSGLPNRAAGNNLIEGSLKQVVEVLDELSGVQPDNDTLYKNTVDLMWKRRMGS